MRIRNFKTLIVVMFMGVFMIKMAISLAPVFLHLDTKTVRAVILQLEQESKTGKENPDKDAFKEKKAFDEYYLYSVAHITFVTESNILHNQEDHLYKQAYHPVVPTPPPNV
ncbi:hypothetical protein G7092_29345 [Mucilaginibacter sp. HC2]|jgi:hypothetical protein|uniref:hypothetical protein n=1 Tax=Mucilaginibacter inviolabilis TaxID=2714892 RepID=UPI00140AF133|nr:hypothetical protein [Mucilaginibacter inviolabilis]NHA07941.1 hypothetical protein [Mucilaginibacter inviolabilis]